MAEIDNYLLGPTAPEENKSLGTAGDFAKTFGAGAADVGADLAALSRYYFEEGRSPNAVGISKKLQELFNLTSDTIEGTINPETQKLINSQITSEEFLSHPILGTALKVTKQLPNIAALAIPAGLMANTVRRAMVLSAGGAAINAGAGIDEFYDKLGKMSDAELQKESPKYAAMRERMDEQPARERFNKMAQGWAPMLNAVIGAASANIGPAGVAARGIAGGAKNAVIGAGERGRLASAGIAAAQGAGSEAAEEGAQDYLQQGVEMEAELQKEFDIAQNANAALEGGFLGGVMGGAVGGIAGGQPRKKAAPAEIDLAATTRTPDPQVQNGTTGVPARPAEIEANPQNAPTTTPRDKGKANPKIKPPKEPATPATVPIDPAVALAVASNEGAPTAQPTEVAAMQTRSPNDTLDKLDQEGQVPPEVTPPELDTGMNVPEQPESIAAQIAQIGTGERKAVMAPAGTVVPADALGGRKDLKRLKLGRGTFIYDPKLTTPAEITKLSKAGRENELLGLGPVSKPEAIADAAAGATPLAVTERTPAGTEVKAAAGTTATLPGQRASLEAQKTPGNVVAVETPTQVVEKRNAAGGRILPNLTTTAETTPLSDFNANKVEEKTEGPGKNYRGKAGAARDEKIANAKNIVERNAPDVEFEREYLTNPAVRDKVIARAEAMVADAKAAGLTIQKQLKKSAKGDATSDDPAIQILRLAKDLATVASKHKEGRARTEATQAFAEAERLIRAGHSDEVLATRREEGDARFKKNVAGDQVAAASNVVEAPQAAADEVSMEGGANENIVGKDDVTTTTADSAKMGMRGVGDGTEKTESGEVRAKAARTKVYTPEEIAAMGFTVSAKKGAPERAPTKAKATARAKKAGVPEAVYEKLVKSVEAPAKATQAQLNAQIASEAKKNELAVNEDAAAAWLAANDPDAKRPQQEALRVNRNPTPAQAKAGNYKKGHRRVEGLPFTIETPKGAVRVGYDENGNVRWRAKAPADYGYILRTKGADGEQIDAHDLRTGKRHFVVDQLDEQTGEFDEHKIMLRAKDEKHAVDTYVASYSDGKGPDRLGNIHEVTAPELKDWLDSANTAEPITATLDRDMDRVNTDSLFDGPKFSYGPPIKADEAIDKIDFSRAFGVNMVVSRFIAAKLKKLAKDVDVMFISPRQMEDLGHKGASGLHVRNVDTGRSEVYISRAATEMGTGTEYGEYGHVLLHELVHAVTVREIETVPGARTGIAKLAQIADRYIGDPQNHWQLEMEFGGQLQYGFTNAKEFIAEAFSNPSFQQVLARIPLDPETARFFGLHQKKMSVWDVFRGYVKKAVQRVTGEIPQFDSVLDGIIKVGEHLTSVHETHYAGTKGEAVQAEAFRMVDDAKRTVQEWLAKPENNTPERSAKALGLRTFDNIASLSDYFFGESNPVRKIHTAIERMRVTGERLFERSEPIVRLAAELRAKNPEVFHEWSSLLHDATVANVHPDVPLSDAKNAHLGKNRVVGSAVWSKAQHAELSKRFNALPEEFKAAWHKTTKYYADQQNAMSLGIINNQILKLIGVEDAALGDRIHNNALTDADRDLLGGNLDVIERASELSKIEGPYVPLIRRGDHVVIADYKVTPPGNAKKIAPNEFEFTTEKEASDYAKASSLQPTIRKVWVDEKTGELNQIDPATGKEHRMRAEDLDSVARYRVELQTRHVEYVQGRRAADARAAELAQDKTLEVAAVVPRAREPDGRQAVELSSALSALVKKLEKSDAYKDATPTQRATMRQAIEEASLASHGSTRVSSRALPRRGVKGYSEDMVQGLVDYSASSSRYLAKLEHGTALENGIADMKAALDAGRHDKVKQYGRTAISNEVLKRVEGDNGFQQGGALAPITKRLLSASFTDKLGSPAYSVINAMQTVMITTPYLVGRHGVGRTFAAMGKAYADLNTGAAVKKGVVETGKKFAAKAGQADFLGDMIRTLSADEKAMIQEHLDVGTIDANAGMEITNLVKDYSGVAGKVDAVLGYLEGVTRQMPRAIETINRSVTALATYRLERGRGATHEAAVQASKDAVNNTQFNYAPTNSPALFNHPLLKLALQFKKYGQGMYQLIGTQIGNAMRNEKPGDRAQAVKTLIGIAATHTAMAGALGLPTEPFKYLLMGASAVGLPVGTWADVEDKIRRGAAEVFGKTGGEVVTRGLPRLVNLDLSRMGLDSVTSFGEPRGKKDTDVKAWLFDSVSGPVASLGVDYIKGINNAANGDFQKAAEQLIPLKAASDALRAYRQATEGKKSATSGRQTMTPYTPTETALRTLGFGSGREAETNAAAGAYYRQSAAQKEARGELVKAWADAKPTEKTKAWAAIVKWNQSQPKEVRISPKELTSKAKRDAKQAQTAVRGINPNKRDKRFLDEGFIYNVQ